MSERGFCPNGSGHFGLSGVNLQAGCSIRDFDKNKYKGGVKSGTQEGGRDKSQPGTYPGFALAFLFIFFLLLPWIKCGLPII